MFHPKWKIRISNIEYKNTLYYNNLHKQLLFDGFLNQQILGCTKWKQGTLSVAIK